MGSHQRFQRFTVRRQNNHRIGRPARASRLPLSASDSSCHGAADSTPVLLSESSLAQTTFVPSRKAESQLPLGGTSRVCRAHPYTDKSRHCDSHSTLEGRTELGRLEQRSSRSVSNTS